VKILQRNPQQLRPNNKNNNSNLENNNSNLENLNNVVVVRELGYKLKSNSFDGFVLLREFFSQFELIAQANH